MRYVMHSTLDMWPSAQRLSSSALCPATAQLIELCLLPPCYCNRPHLPFVFPEEYAQYYPLDSIQLPPNQFAPWDMPLVAWQNYGETRSYADIAQLHATGNPNTTLPEKVVKELRRGYYSAVSYTDYNVGEVLDMLNESPVANSTIVLLWGDHG